MLEFEIDSLAFRELAGDISYGGSRDSKPGSISGGGFYATVADQPLAIRLSEVCRSLHVGRSVGKYYKRFELWMIPHRVAIMRRSGLAEPVAVGIDIEYLTGNRVCSVIELIPSFKYVVHGELRVAGKFSASGDFAGVQADLPPSTARPKWPGIGFQAIGSAEIGFDLSARVATPVIHATGLGSKHCQWRFDRYGEMPLYGHDIETWSVLALSRYEEELRYRMRFYIISRTLFVPCRWESDWAELACTLPSSSL